MPLKDVQLRTAKPAAKPYKLKDGGGLHLLVTPAGGRLWRLRYEWGGKEKSLALGQYPEVSLAAAREARDAAKAELREGTDPSAAKRQRKAVAVQVSVETLAREWHGLHVARWAPVHAADVLTSLKRDVLPALGHVPVRQITAPMVLEALRKIEKRGSGETAHLASIPRSSGLRRTLSAPGGTANVAATNALRLSTSPEWSATRRRAGALL